MRAKGLKNICIIAHVDHGKTTLVDQMLLQTGILNNEESERVLDANELEKERGITILSKVVSMNWKDTRVNLIDTPGHSDFGGEVERVLGLADGSLLLVDAVEGPLPQTRFVLQKALAKGHTVLVGINKVDRGEIANEGQGRLQEVLDEVFDLFIDCGASEEQCDFPVFYLSGRQGIGTKDADKVPDLLENPDNYDLIPLLDGILEYVSSPEIQEGEFKMQVTDIFWSEYHGCLGLGRILAGKAEKGQRLNLCHYDEDKELKRSKVSLANIFRFEGLDRQEGEELVAGDIGMIACKTDLFIGDCLGLEEGFEPMPPIDLEPPTLKMIFTINTGPFSGKEGKAIQSRMLKDRLIKETRKNVALKFEETDSSEQFFVLGRGELQFAILIETMRREGIEFMVGRPLVQFKVDENGKQEPLELVTVQLPKDHVGEVTEQFQTRKGKLLTYEDQLSERTKLTFEIPTRTFIGMRSRFLTLTRGQGLMSSELKGYVPYLGQFFTRKNGTLIADRAGKTTDYALKALEDRGTLIIKPGSEVYEGMVIGEAKQENDMNVNPVKPKKLTNVRSVSSDGLIILNKTRDMSLEDCIEWIDEDEWIECTPESVRIRKKALAGNQRSIIRRS